MEICVLLSVHSSCSMILFCFWGWRPNVQEASAQQFVQGLRADGMTEAQIRSLLKEGGYKTGRVSKLLAATRASGSGGPGPGANEAGFSVAIAAYLTGGSGRCMLTLRCRLGVLCFAPCGKIARNCVRSPVRSGALVARMPLLGVARWLRKGTRHGFFFDLTSSVVISFGMLSNMATLKLTFEACHVWSGTRGFWSQSFRGCHRPPPALRKASSSKRLGSRASAAVGAKAAGGSGASRRP